MTGVEPPLGPPFAPWSQRTKDRWFFGALALSTLSIAVLFSPFLYVVLVASVIVVVSWPLYRRVTDACGGRRTVAAVLTTLLIAVAVLGPLSLLVYLFAKEAVAVGRTGITFVQSGGLVEWVEYVSDTGAWMPPWLQSWLPADFDLQSTIGPPLQDAALRAFNVVGNAAPAVLGMTLNAAIGGVLFLLTVVTLYAEGPRLLRVLANLSPMDDSYEERLLGVFTEFANNIVVGTLATSVIQGAFAAVGYGIAGVDRVIFFAMLTAVFSFIPLVGTMLIWVPLAVATGIEHGLGWGIFLAVWGVLISQIDNFIRPMFMRGRTNIHPLLLFFAVFGGIAWMGLPGALVGPVLVALFLAMYMIYVENYLGKATPELGPSPRRDHLPHSFRKVVHVGRAALEAAGIRKAGAVEPTEEDTPSDAPGPTPGV
jgi:predicted PurR-regulated permease PerM